ncbi:MAG: DUF2946 family protein [Notoacmeibacter sp.]|nr:DUF2946 family protein [Notoacmeibacter sp.]MCC0032219.1 DUF2946 family protein [Brucellaceae bacterium]
MDRLRRDGPAFAILAAFAILTAFLQPLAEARAAGTPYAGVICSTYGTQKAGPDGTPTAPAAADDCPFCLAMSGGFALLVPAEPLVRVPRRIASPVHHATLAAMLPGQAVNRAQPIRGPPVLS